MRRLFLLVIPVLVVTSCGGTTAIENGDVPTDAPPTVTRIDPATLSAGSTMTIFGFGFSVVAQSNIIALGESVTSATDYALVDPPTSAEIESLTLTIPSATPSGDYAVVVTVGDVTSNTNIMVTVTP